MIRLHINLDHVATLRNQRDTTYPEPGQAARLCLEAGADGITVHLREDRRHIRDHDVEQMRRMISLPKCLNLEMAATEEMAAIAARVRPDAVTLVPERREERTTEGGLDASGNREAISRVARVCQEIDARLSLFIEADTGQVRVAQELGADQVEFHTGHYCDAPAEQREALLPAFFEAASLADELGMQVAAGHGLHAGNIAGIVKIPHLVELNIGHSVVSEAVMVGLPDAVRHLRAAIALSLEE